MKMQGLVLSATVLSVVWAHPCRADAVIDGLIAKKTAATKTFDALTKQRDALQAQKDVATKERTRYLDSKKDDPKKCGSCIAKDKKGCTYADFIPSLAAIQRAEWNRYLKETPEAKDGNGNIALTAATQKMNALMGFNSQANNSCSILYFYYVEKLNDPGLAKLTGACHDAVVACPKIGFDVKFAVLDPQISDLDDQILAAAMQRDEAMSALGEPLLGPQIDARTLRKGPTNTTNHGGGSGTTTGTTTDGSSPAKN